MKKILLFSIWFLLLPILSFGDQEIQILEIDGFGISRNEAIQNGLIEALKQAKGISIDSQKAFAKSIQQTSTSEDGLSTQQVEINSLSESLVKEATQGLINEYRIIDAIQQDTGGWNVKLEIKMLRYITPGISPHSRRKIAVIPFRTLKTSYLFQGRQVISSEISHQFTQKLVTEIAQTRKFTVLDREYMMEFLREKNLVLSGDAPTSEQMKVGEVLGVDYLVIGTIRDASLLHTAEFVPVLNETVYKDQALLIADYRIMVMATRQIKWSDSIALNLDSKELKKLVPSKSPQLIQQAMLNKAAEMIAQRAIENIYPIRIAQLQGDNQFILNQGGTSVSTGDLLDVFSPGAQVIDQYTGESLGAAESWVAKLQIVRVIPKMSYAKVVDGTAENIQEGYICRRTSLADVLNYEDKSVKKQEKQLVPKW
jgi:TolB-like protein